MADNCIIKLLRSKWGQLIGWQICSILICGSGTMCTYIARNFEMTIPLLMLSMTYFIIFLFSCWRIPKTDVPKWRYFVISLGLIAGDYTAVTAFNTTSLASAMVFVTTVIFWVCPFAYFFFGRKVSLIQFFAIILSLSGGALVFVADGTEGSRWLGNVLALVSSFSYAVTNIFQEWTIHSGSMHAYLFFFSLGAFPVALALSGITEWKIIRDYQWCTKSIVLTISYAFILAFFNIASSFVMQYSDATTMNISMLTSNFFSLAISIIFFDQKASWLYLVGFCCIPIAIVIFSLFGPKENVLPDEVSKSLLSENAWASMTDATDDRTDTK
ncbi:Integral membrane protein [Tritrichomonas foetus]|uniref:Integral membrane protein n=1 Tax=Tritrichomonas foetus TaxID=1144522 RepID=A0A1J4KNC1_9EUKA|nr:Integral membrane protein [Tritrichomonas foetus]|eukprot:OHT12618.1 Integral membrane protein [Tritrichomonas foetus]